MNTYLLFKSLHLIAVISWMAGLLYLPRIFVYHAETVNNKDKYDTFLVMERRLLIYIMNPSMILSWIFGLLLVHSNGINSFGELWMILKIILVLILTFYILSKNDICQNQHPLFSYWMEFRCHFENNG